MLNLDKFFNPQSLAVIGASDNPQKIGWQIYHKLKTANKKVYPINPKFKLKSISQVSGQVDQAIIIVPAFAVPQVIRECIIKKVNSIVIISAGFSESGPAGAQLEQAIKADLQNTEIIVLGPNCLGYACPANQLDLTFAKTPPPSGKIALITQSGAIGSYLFDWAKAENLGFSHFVSLGNRIGISENEFLNYLALRPEVKVIGLYLESFAKAVDFLRVASRVSQKKPIVALFGGLTSSGQQAAASHTAALSPPAEAVKTAFKQSGCLLVESLAEFTDLLELFSLEPPLKDNDLAIVTNAGGPAILATDTASRYHLNVDKPLDVFGDALAEQFQAAFTKVIKDKVKDAFLIIITPQTSTELELTAKTIVSQFKTVRKPVVVSLLGGKITTQAEQILKDNQIATIEFPQNAAALLGRLFDYWQARAKTTLYPARAKKVIIKKNAWLSGRLSWQTIKKLARSYSLPLIKTQIIQLKNFSAVIKEIGYPLVLKSDPATGAHRTEQKALYLNLKSPRQVKTAFSRLQKNFPVILTQPQVDNGHELFLGWQRLKDFPVLLTLGSGGIYTEIYQDVCRSFLPLNRQTAVNLLEQTKIGQILQGVRGVAPIDVKPLIDLILNASQMMLENPSLKTLDINPAILSYNSLTIVDIKITATNLRGDSL